MDQTMISRSDVSVDTVVVRDPPATSFTVAYPGGEGDMLYLHAWPGDIIGGLLLVAFAVGPDRYAARASPLYFFSRHDSSLCRDLQRSQARRWLGHNPPRGAKIIALILMPALVTVSGMALSAQPKQAGHLLACCAAPCFRRGAGRRPRVRLKFNAAPGGIARRRCSGE